MSTETPTKPPAAKPKSKGKPHISGEGGKHGRMKLAKAFYFGGEDRSLDAAADSVTPKLNKTWVRTTAAKQGWARERREFFGRAHNEALQDAFADRKATLEALLRFEYGDAMGHLNVMQRQRIAEGHLWKPAQHLTHAHAMEARLKQARLSLGLPTSIEASPKEAADYEAKLAAIEADRIVEGI